MTSQNHRNPSPTHPLVSLPQENLSLTFHFLHRSPVLCLAMPSPGTRAHTAHFGPGTPPTLLHTLLAQPPARRSELLVQGPMCESNSGDKQLSIFPSYPTPTSDPHFSWTLQGMGKTA